MLKKSLYAYALCEDSIFVTLLVFHAFAYLFEYVVKDYSYFYVAHCIINVAAARIL